MSQTQMVQVVFAVKKGVVALGVCPDVVVVDVLVVGGFVAVVVLARAPLGPCGIDSGEVCIT